MPDEDLIGAPAVAKRLNVCKKYVYQLVESGEIGYVRFGRRGIRFWPSEVDAYLARCTVTAVQK